MDSKYFLHDSWYFFCRSSLFFVAFDLQPGLCQLSGMQKKAISLKNFVVSKVATRRFSHCPCLWHNPSCCLLHSRFSTTAHQLEELIHVNISFIWTTHWKEHTIQENSHQSLESLSVGPWDDALESGYSNCQREGIWDLITKKFCRGNLQITNQRGLTWC